MQTSVVLAFALLAVVATVAGHGGGQEGHKHKMECRGEKVIFAGIKDAFEDCKPKLQMGGDKNNAGGENRCHAFNYCMMTQLKIVTTVSGRRATLALSSVKNQNDPYPILAHFDSSKNWTWVILILHSRYVFEGSAKNFHRDLLTSTLKGLYPAPVGDGLAETTIQHCTTDAIINGILNNSDMCKATLAFDKCFWKQFQQYCRQ